LVKNGQQSITRIEFYGTAQNEVNNDELEVGETLNLIDGIFVGAFTARRN